MQRSPKISFINENNFKTIFKEYYSELLRYCLKFVRKPEIAEEIVQDQFVYLWDKRKKIKITSSIKSYLYKSVRNKSIDYLKSSYVNLIFENEDTILNKEGYLNPADEIQMKDLEAIVEKAIKKLPEKCYTIFTMSRNGGLSNKEIAKRLEISIKTVENQITIALKKIKEHIENYR